MENERRYRVQRVCRVRRCKRAVVLVCVCVLAGIIVMEQIQIDLVNVISTYGLSLQSSPSAEELRSLHRATAYFDAQPSCAHRTMTVVSGYFNIGSFRKGIANVFTAGHYRQWANAMGAIENPMVFFTDDINMARQFISLRNTSRNRVCTRFHFITNRNVFWGFQLRGTIAIVLGQPGYPTYYPNTVLPEYGAVMHSKYSMLQMAIDADPFHTAYFAWMDVGLFREEADWKDRPIRLLPPLELDPQRVAFNVAFEARFDWPAETIFTGNHVYVGGGYFLARKSVMSAWCEQYRNFTEYFLQRGLSSTDQQVIYAMFTDEFRNHSVMKRVVLIQPFSYRSTETWGDWYQLRKLSRDTGDREIAMENMANTWNERRTTAVVQTSSAETASTSAWQHAETSQQPTFTSSQSQDATVCDSHVTVVTGYFDFGAFATAADSDGTRWTVHDAVHYRGLLAQFTRMRNALLVYSDSTTVLDAVLKARTQASLGECTRVVFVSRSELWSWQLLPSLYTRVSDRHAAVLPEMYAALHSKFTLLLNASRQNPFASMRFAWTDASTLLELSDKLRNFVFRIAPQFTTTAASTSTSADDVFDMDLAALSRTTQTEQDARQTLCDRASAFSSKYFVVHRAALPHFTAAYQAVVQRTLSWNVTLRDDEILHAAFCWLNLTQLATTGNTRIRPFYTNSADDKWRVALAEASVVYL